VGSGRELFLLGNFYPSEVLGRFFIQWKQFKDFSVTTTKQSAPSFSIGVQEKEGVYSVK